MRRFPVRAAAVFACALATTGCASLGLGDSPAEPADTGSATAAQSAPDTASDNLIDSKSTNLDAEIRRAQLMRVRGDFAGAIHVLSQLMLVAPDDPRVVGEYGKALAQQGRSSDAMAFLNRAIELQPDNWTLYSALGVTYDQLNERTRAEKAYKHALALKPGDPTVLNNYAVSQMLAGNLDRAEDLLHQAAAHGGDHPKIANNLEMIAHMRAQRGAASGRPESAIKPAPTRAVAKAALPAVKMKASRPAKTAVAAARTPRKLQPAVPAKKAKPRVVMEKVPYDPLAGKVYGKHGTTQTSVAATKPARATRHVAAAKAKPEAKTASAAPEAPALRTAADIY